MKMLSTLCAAVAAIAANPAAAVAAFGAPFPGSVVSSTEPGVDGCGVRYKLATPAALAIVAKFYLIEGRQAGLTLVKDTDVEDPNYRMILLMKPHVHQLLFAVLTRTSAGTNGQVYFTSANSRQCR